MLLLSFSTTTLLILILLPIAILQVLLLILLPAMHAPGARAAGILKATYSYAMQGVGIILMTAGALPALRGVLEKLFTGFEEFSAQAYMALLLMFIAGGATFLWHERMAEKIEDASQRVPALLFWYTFKTIGFLLVLFSLASIIFTMLLEPYDLDITWWMTPTVLLAYGLLLSWCTRMPQAIGASFKSIQVVKNIVSKKKR